MLSFYPGKNQVRRGEKKEEIKMYLINLAGETITLHTKGLQLIGGGIDEGPVLQQRYQAGAKHKLGIKDQNKGISYFRNSALPSLADTPKAVEVE